MFWARKLKKTEDTDSSWALSYGDLATLLLAVFVMIAAMGEVKADAFKRVTGGVRQAFGFAALHPGTAAQLRKPPTLLERLEQAGFAHRTQLNLVGPDDAVLAPCDLLIEGDQMVLRIAGHASFGEHDAALQPAADKALRRLAEFLADGGNRIEVRGHAEADPLPEGTLYRDRMDLSYARARNVATALAQHGVSRNRIFVTAWGDSDPLSAEPELPQTAGLKRLSATPPRMELPEGGDRRIEIIVHAVPAAEHES